MEFCSSIFNPRFTSDKPSVDGYEVTNLINDNHMSVTNGFVCESFVRPPANVVIDFPVPIDIAFVVIDAQVKEKRSKGFSLFTQTKEKCSLSNYSRSDNQQLMEHDDFCLGKWFCNNESKIILNNSQYRHWLFIPLPNKKKNVSDLVGTLKHSNKLALSSVKTLTIRILSVAHTGPPVLRQVQVWGQPSVTASPSQKRRMIHMWTHQNKQQNLKQIHLPKFYNSEEDNRQNVEKKESPSNLPQYDDEDIPEEFLDLLTCEIMTIPILLPSGNSIDMFSLEKYTANEGIWGRPASDPFTGVAFKNKFQPAPNVHLKARIDRYLLLNKKLPANHTGMGHTLASSEDHRKDLENSKKRKFSSTNEDVVITPQNCVKVQPKETFQKSFIQGTVSTHKNTGHGASYSSCLDFQKPQTSQAIITNDTVASPSSMTVESLKKSTSVKDTKKTGHSLIHSLGSAANCSSKRQSQVEARLVKSSTDSNLSLPILSKFTSNFDLPRPQSLKKGECQIKEISLQDFSSNALTCICGARNGNFYSLICSHIMCSLCVTSKRACTQNSIQCNACGKISNKHEVKRAHPKSVFAV